jgi:hypothetical protein
VSLPSDTLLCMDFSRFIAVIGGVVGLVGGFAGILSWLNQRKQTTALQGQLEVMREQLLTVKQLEGTAAEWAGKFDEAAKALIKISPSTIITAPSTATAAYGYIFQDDDLRRRIEIYLGRRRWFKSTFLPTTLGKEQLQNPVVQQTIQRVLDTVAEFKREHTDFARALKLL